MYIYIYTYIYTYISPRSVSTRSKMKRGSSFAARSSRAKKSKKPEAMKEEEISSLEDLKIPYGPQSTAEMRNWPRSNAEDRNICTSTQTEHSIVSTAHVLGPCVVSRFTVLHAFYCTAAAVLPGGSCEPKKKPLQYRPNQTGQTPPPPN